MFFRMDRAKEKARMIPESLDWVRARYECSVGAMFREIQADAAKDVASRNELRDAVTKRHVFHYQADGDKFVILRDDSGPCRVFSLETDRITVQDRDRRELLSATVKLNGEGRCMLVCDGIEVERWQFLKQALESLFFDQQLT